ncbi:hypothetical protein DY000_02021020 [Brassica cretica]|uniref:Uncharacterized protein n=1 Tax=Brassica cretica TaxID=69181 RepID=A0ABQ7EIM6_BRACR|nr:hypothetical protein DY000_02021021 [Brassica cretica]KAF3597093.1 hypothetical protein DY000_02021020 [Brassica cretica]
MVFTTQHDVCFSNYVSDYFRADILHLQVMHMFLSTKDIYLTKNPEGKLLVKIGNFSYTAFPGEDVMANI